MYKRQFAAIASSAATSRADGICAALSLALGVLLLAALVLEAAAACCSLISESSYVAFRLSLIHIFDLLGCQFSFELSKSQCPIPGSYQIENMATIQTKGKPDRRFSMFRHKRYDEMELTRSLARCGWYRVASIEYGPEKNTVAMLLVKRDAAT